MKLCPHADLKAYFSKSYENICLAITVMLVGYSIFVYVQNRDISRIQYEQYHSTIKDIYPSISLCFGDVLDLRKLEAHGANKTSYWKFLQGEDSDKKLFDINFDDVSINLTEFLLGIEMTKEEYNGDTEEESYFLLDNTMQGNMKMKGNTTWKPKIYQDGNPFWGMIQKCLTIDIPFVPSNQMNWITIIMNRSVFLSGKRPSKQITSKEVFSVDIHYPGQRYRFANRRTSWSDEEPTDQGTNTYGMRFEMENMEVIHQRNTRKTVCQDDRTDEDEALKAYMINDIHCRPPYWMNSENSSTTKCSTKDELRRFYKLNIGNYTVPCRRLILTSYKYSEYPSTYYNNILGTNHFYVALFIQHKNYKEIVLTRQFDLQSLIGNAGGYVGICVGYTILQLPQLITSIVSKLRSCVGSH